MMHQMLHKVPSVKIGNTGHNVHEKVLLEGNIVSKIPPNNQHIALEFFFAAQSWLVVAQNNFWCSGVVGGWTPAAAKQQKT